MLNRIVAV